MAMVIAVLQGFLLITVLLVGLYVLRHLVFSWVRLHNPQRAGYQDLLQNQWPSLSVLVPMHNEEKVAKDVLEALLDCDYPADRLEIIPIDDHSQDRTTDILRIYSGLYPNIRPLFRRSGLRGKPSGLNDALARASGEIILIFDADYLPPKGILKMLIQPFSNPEVGATMGRVVPKNVGRNLLTRLLDLERTGGYQADQQARYSLDLLVQYGGTVGGFRRDVVRALGGFDPNVLAEDTHLTLQLYSAGWKVAYVNRAECYEESPETWEARYKQLRRWARGHMQVMLHSLPKLVGSPFLSRAQKLDGLFLLMVYLMAPLLLTGFWVSLLLFCLGALPSSLGVAWILAVALCGGLGNFAPFYEIGSGNLLDGAKQRILLLPTLMVSFVFSMLAASHGVMLALVDALRGQQAPIWEKTLRFRDKPAEQRNGN